MATVLVTGISGSLARLTATVLRQRGDEVVGVDYRPRPAHFPSSVAFYQANYNKTRIEDVFRRHRPEGVIHLGRVGTLRVEPDKRFELNVMGSAKIQQLSVKYGVRRLVVLSTFHIYGAHPHNHVPILEDEPLRALQTVPELADAIQLDSQAVTWTFRHRDLKTTVLRATNVTGPHVRNTVSRYLRLRRIPYLAGFNPMWQFIHESDMVRALVLALDDDEAVGVFNLAGRDVLPLVEALELTGAPLLPVPSPLAGLWARLAGESGPALPGYMIDFLKYPVVIGDQRFRDHFGFEPEVGIVETVASARERLPLGPVLS